MKKFKFLPLFLMIALLLPLVCPTFAAAVADPAVSVPAAMVLDQRTGEVIFAKGEDQKIYPASTTKIMTVLLAVEAVERGDVYLSDEVTATDNAMLGLIAEGSTAGITVGETLTLEQLLYCAMVSSANEACNIIAEHICGSVSGFVSLMNDRAKELGCTGTHFSNTHGLPDEQHYTTASDFSRIALEATRHSHFMKVCGTAEITIPATNKAGERVMYNSNALLTERSMYGSSFVYQGASGIKTGHTNAAGYCLVSSASRDKMSYLVLVFGAADSNTCFQDSTTLLNWAFDNFSYQEILKSTENIASVDIAMGSDADYVNLRPSTSISALLPNDVELSQFDKKIRVYALENGETVTAPVAAGEVLGEVSMLRNGRLYGTTKLVASSTVELSRAQYIKSQIRETTRRSGFKITVTILVLLLLLYIVWVTMYRIKRIRHRRAVQAAKMAGSAASRPSTASHPTRSAGSKIDYFSSAPSGGGQANGEIVELPKGKKAAPTPSASERMSSDSVREADKPSVSSRDKEERDYFEEFFKNNKS